MPLGIEVAVKFSFDFVSVLNKAVIRQFEWLGDAGSEQFISARLRNLHGVANL